MAQETITLTIEKQKKIALIAHDNKKEELIQWCDRNQDILKKHFLCGTGTTARLITETDKIIEACVKQVRDIN